MMLITLAEEITASPAWKSYADVGAIGLCLGLLGYLVVHHIPALHDKHYAWRKEERGEWLDAMTKIGEDHKNAVTELTRSHAADMSRLHDSIERLAEAIERLESHAPRQP